MSKEPKISPEETHLIFWALVIAALCIAWKLLPEYLAVRNCPECVPVQMVQPD
jgi:hypothetical protein